MSYNQLEKIIDKKIEKYQDKVGKSYYTYYYYQALDLLDKYILDLANNQKHIEKIVFSELLEKSYEYQDEFSIFKNYILSLVIENKKEELREILNSSIYSNDEGKEINQSTIIYYFIDYYLNPKKFLDKDNNICFSKVCHYLDYIDYRILYVLYKKYNVDIFNIGEEYILYSYENNVCSRKTLKSRLGLYCTLNEDKMYEKSNLIVRDIQYFGKIQDRSFYDKLVNVLYKRFEKGNRFKDIDVKTGNINLKSYNYLLNGINKDIYIKYKAFYDCIIKDYCDYIRFNVSKDAANDDIRLLEKINKYNQELSVLADYNYNSKKYLNALSKNNKKNEHQVNLKLLIRKLKQNTYFTDAEMKFMEKSNDPYLLFCLENTYRIKILDENINLPKIVLCFEDYPQNHIVLYNENINYYLPDNLDIKRMNEINHKKLDIEVTHNGNSYKVEQIKGVYSSENFIEISADINNIGYKFFIYKEFSNIEKLLKTLSENNLEFDLYMLKSFINFKYIFNKLGNYEKILKKIRDNVKSNYILSDEIIELRSIISDEIGDKYDKERVIYKKIGNLKNTQSDNSKNSDEDFVKVIEEIIELYYEGINIKYPIFTSMVKKAIENKYYDNILFIGICEKFIYDHKLVDSIVYDYMRTCYIKTYLITEYTDEVKKIINFYNDEQKDNGETLLNYGIRSNQFTSEFINTFKSLCTRLGKDKYTKNQLITNAIDFMINLEHYNEFVDDLGIIEIIENIYLENKKSYKYLEAVVYRCIKNGQSSRAREYLEDIVNYYLEEEVITVCSKDILLFAYENKYYRDFKKIKEREFNLYFIEYLKYELINCKDFKENETIKIQYYKIQYYNDRESKEENKKIIEIKPEQIQDKDFILVDLGYIESYYINSNLVNRKIKLDNYDIFIDGFDLGNKEFKIKSLEIIKSKDLYNKNIIEYFIRNRKLFGRQKEYTKLCLDYLEREVDSKNDTFDKYNKEFKSILSNLDLDLDDSKDIERILTKIENLNNTDKYFEFEIFKQITEKHKNIKFSSEYIKHIVYKYKKEEQEFFYDYLYYNMQLLKEPTLIDVFFDYISDMEYINYDIVILIENIISYVWANLETKELIINTVIDLILDNYLKTTIHNKENKFLAENIIYSLYILINIDKEIPYRDKGIYKKVIKYYPFIKDYLTNSNKSINRNVLIDLFKFDNYLIDKFSGSLIDLDKLVSLLTKEDEKHQLEFVQVEKLVKMANKLREFEINQIKGKDTELKVKKLTESIQDIYKNILSKLEYNR